jgi:hypothetical protein
VEDVVSDRDQDSDKPLGASVDLDAWDAESPPPDFAERVLARLQGPKEATKEAKPQPSPARARRWGLAGGAAAALALAAAVAVRVGAAPPAHGEAVAQERTEVAIGSRALAVLEPGARVLWDGDDVVQPRGDVFYRVEKGGGARFRVHTPAGDVEVKGTCFTVKVTDMQKRDMKSGAVGAALTALAFVAVYEGKVAVSHAGERVELTAGQTAQAGADGVRGSGDLGEGQRAYDAKVSAAAQADSVATANENLVSQVSDYRKRLELLAQQKGELEDKLKKTEDKLAAADGSAPKKNDFDLGADDWKELAKDGTMKMQIPCKRGGPAGYQPKAGTLRELGLAPQDAATLQSAYAKSYQRQWSVIRPLCAQVLGHEDAADKVGPESCPHVILDLSRAKDPETTNEAMREVAEIRAGLRAMPGPNDPVAQNPAFKMFIMMTGEMTSFEGDLAQSFGPEEAHRLSYADAMCMGHSTWGGPGPREAK